MVCLLSLVGRLPVGPKRVVSNVISDWVFGSLVLVLVCRERSISTRVRSWGLMLELGWKQGGSWGPYALLALLCDVLADDVHVDCSEELEVSVELLDLGVGAVLCWEVGGELGEGEDGGEGGLVQEEGG